MDDRQIALRVVESLRRGTPPRRGVDLYSVGHEILLGGIERHHLANIADCGTIRFLSGSWGAGKTHFFRVLREAALRQGCLVSNVELNVNDAALDKFERIFYSIVRNVETPVCYEAGIPQDAAPFSYVVREALSYLATGAHDLDCAIAYEDYSVAREKLMADREIDIDFRKMIEHYWKTYLPEAPDPAVLEQERAEILEWFSGEGTISAYRKRFGVNKMVSRENARLMLQSLAGFVRLGGYRGLVILFDEAEQAYSVMRKSSLRNAHNNLLSLINNIENLNGMFMVYATTPDFYVNEKHGIVVYGALAGRIGKPEMRPPRALDIVWNFDALETTDDDYRLVARKIRDIYETAYPGSESTLPDEAELDRIVTELIEAHPTLASVRFWRVLVTASVGAFDDRLEGDGAPAPTAELYASVMDRLRDE